MTSLFEALAVSLPGRVHSTTLAVDAGELVAIVGPNGGGKTSLLRACAGIDGSADALLIDGEELRSTSSARRPLLLAYLPASRDVIWPILVRDLVSLALPSNEPERVDELLHLLELEALADRPVDQLSTGERSRVLLARALAPRPRLLLLDEPLSNLDPHWVLRLLQLFRRVSADGTAVIAAVHDIERLSGFDRVLLVNAGEVRADLTPDAMLTSPEFPLAFRIERCAGSWRVSS